MHEVIAEWISNGQTLLDDAVDKIRRSKAEYSDAMLNDVEMLLRNGVTPNTPNSQNHATPLHIAARSQSEILTLLLWQHGASLTAVNKFGATPLHNASRESLSVRMVKFLIEKGSHINAQTTNGDTPLHQAMRNSRKENVCALVLAGADATIKNKDGDTPQQMECSPSTRKMYFIALNVGPEEVVHKRSVDREKEPEEVVPKRYIDRVREIEQAMLE